MSLNCHSRDAIMESFLETVRPYRFLFDKTHSDYKDKDAKLNRWTLIGKQFGLTGPQAAAKFKNVKDRWLKIVSASEGARKSGAGGDTGKIRTKWALFDIVDGMLRSTPHYAERTATNVPHENDMKFLLSSLSYDSSASPRLVPRASQSPAGAIFQGMHYDSPAELTDEDELRHPNTPEYATAAAGPSGSSNMRAEAVSPSPGSAKRPAANGPSPRTKRKQNENFDEAVKEVFGNCSVTLLENQKRSEMPEQNDESHEAATWIASMLRRLAPKKRCELTFQIHKLLYEATMEQYEINDV